MCTLTVVPHGRGRYRVAFNRDESRARPSALPPQRRRFGERQAILPIDPSSGGTWLAVNDAGLLFALTNRNPIGPTPTATKSRGDLIPSLLDSGSFAEVRRRLDTIPANEYAPFRLIALGHPCVAVLTWDGFSPRDELRSAKTPMAFTSSGLGDQLVEGPRLELFESMVARARDPEAGQEAFHQHIWADRPHLSVNMSRADARTVSFTLVEVTPTEAQMTYYPDAPTAAFDTVEIAMARILFARYRPSP